MEEDFGSGNYLAGALAGVGLEDTPENHARYLTLAKQIEGRFAALRKNATETDVLRVLDDGERHIHELLYSGIPFEENLGKRAQLFLQMLADIRSGMFEAPWNTIATVTAALNYMLRESDEVADALPVIGLFDDLLVILMASQLIRSDLDKYSRERGIDLRSLGM